MPIKQVVVNSSPLITLFNSQLATLLPQLFETIAVPSAVWQEVTAYKSDTAAQALPQATWAKQAKNIAIVPAVAAWDLGAGESEVLSYVLEHPDHTAIVDDAAARRCAVSLSIPTLGTVGLIVLAKKKGLIPSVTEAVQALQNSGLWLSESLIDLLRRQAGESP